MGSQWVHETRRGLRSLLLVALLAACVDTREVIVEAGRFEDPPAAAAGFVGYGQKTGNRPVCGNCHIGKAQSWMETAHASAWDDLTGSSAKQPACEGCHTVNALGNASATQGGYASTKDPRYWDVQCESCHGPGLTHITNPDATQPLASLEVSPTGENGCGECHQGAHTPYVEEWAASRHGKRGTSMQTNASCVGCHEARGVFAKWGLVTDYTERDGTTPIPVTCAVCHDPHDATHPGQLRASIAVADVHENLCMKCHYKRAQPELTSAQGPHSPQGPMLLGEDVGWVPPNFTYSNRSIVATHGTERNPRLCAGCHVVQRTVTDATGKLVTHSTGHLFKAIPCLDAQGVPLATSDCAMEQRSYSACAVSGCHGSQNAARNALTVARLRLNNLAATLNALVARLPASEFSTTDGRVTTAEGAKFNASLAVHLGTPAHNPFLMEALLTATIQQVQAQYGLAPAQPVSLENQLGR